MGLMIQAQGMGAQLRYASELLAAYMRANSWLYDPDYALAQDPEFYEKAQRDDDVADAMQQRQHVVAGEAHNIQSGDKRPESKRLSALVEALISEEHLQGFDAARFLIARAVFKGRTYGRLYGQRKTLALPDFPEMEFWVPTEIRDIDKRRFRRRLVDGQMILEYWPVDGSFAFNWTPWQNPEWLIQHAYAEDESSLGSGRGLSEPLYQVLRCKALTILAMNQAVERFGQGLLDYKMDMSASSGPAADLAKIMTDAAARIAKLRALGVFVHDSRDELALLEGSGTGYEMIKFALGIHKGAITQVILGSNLPSQAESGSLALGRVQENTREVRFRFDRKILAQTLTRDLIGAVLRYNAPAIQQLGLDRAAKPRFEITDRKFTDPKDGVVVLQGAHSIGMAVRKDEAYGLLGLTVPGPEDDVIEGQLPGAAPLPGFPGLPGLPPPPPTNPVKGAPPAGAAA